MARRRDAGQPIDASGQLADGTKVDGVVGAAAGAAARPEVFVGTMTEKLLTYALGRGLGVLRHAGGARRSCATPRAHDYRFSSIVLGIVKSTPFQMRMKPAPEAESWRRIAVAAR